MSSSPPVPGTQSDSSLSLLLLFKYLFASMIATTRRTARKMSTSIPSTTPTISPTGVSAGTLVANVCSVLGFMKMGVSVVGITVGAAQVNGMEPSKVYTTYVQYMYI